MSDPLYFKYPSLPLAQHIFTATNPSASKSAQESSLTSLQDAIKEHKMAPLYRQLAHPSTGLLNISGEGSASQPGQPARLRRGSSTTSGLLPSGRKPLVKADLAWDEKLYEEMKADNEKELEAIQKEEDDAVEREGDTEVMAARGKRAEFWARVCDKDKAIEAFEALYEKTSILGTRIDIAFAITRIGLFFNDKLLVKRTVARANTLVESGGDWDRRNRLKAYQGLHLLTIRAHNLAAPLLLDSLSTFTSYELCSYSSLITYALLAGSVSLKRVDFKAKVVDAPEIKAVVGSSDDRLNALTGATSAGPGAGDEEMPDADSSGTTNGNATTTSTTPATPATTNLTSSASGTAEMEDAKSAVDFTPLSTLVSSLYTGNYAVFFTSLARVESLFLTQDRYLSLHTPWFVREMRLRAYAQLLQSYRVVSLASMASDFGVTVDFLDNDLKAFIAAERISCTVDRVNGVVETTRPDGKQRQYGEVVRLGDGLITKLQKYGQAVRLRGSERG